MLTASLHGRKTSIYHEQNFTTKPCACRSINRLDVRGNRHQRGANFPHYCARHLDSGSTGRTARSRTGTFAHAVDGRAAGNGGSS